ncbi:MAG: hypothetical protein LQ342_006746 [Letrouitia transgressa]|nr:MAG: hypothetical protein LQ342_006746 [Letrouitia transgressa]
MFAEGDEETAVPALVSEASGVVLELGPGTGGQLPRYNASKITKVYGVEPAIALHESLRENVKASGLTDVYEIIACGIEDVVELKKHGIALESIDTILSIQVLCSVPDPDEILRRLYALMRPGGQFIVYEHVKSKDVLSRIVQSIHFSLNRWRLQRADVELVDLYNKVWAFFVGNCHLDRNTQQYIMQAGDWEKIELTVPTSEDAWTIFPRIYGRLWKK